MLPSRILVPVDLERGSHAALRYARALAERLGASLLAVHVAEPLDAHRAELVAEPGQPPMPLESWCRLEAMRRVQRFFTDEGLTDCRILAGVPDQEIVRLAEKEATDLIVMGSHGHGRLGRLLLGSIAEKVLRTARRSVLVIPATDPAPELAPAAAPTPILVAVDFSTDSRTALKAAAALATRLGARLRLVHVLPQPFAAGDLLVPALGGVRLADLMRDEGRSKLEELVAERPEIAAVVEGIDLRAGNPAEEIVQTAAERGAQLVVVGTRGLTGISHALLGSVAERVLRGAACPVLVVREADFNSGSWSLD